MDEMLRAWDPSLATRRTRCERCGAVFGCRNTGDPDDPHDCWCSLAEFRLPVPLPEGVGPFEDCLCPACLRAVVAELRAKGHGPTD